MFCWFIFGTLCSHACIDMLLAACGATRGQNNILLLSYSSHEGCNYWHHLKYLPLPGCNNAWCMIMGPTTSTRKNSCYVSAINNLTAQKGFYAHAACIARKYWTCNQQIEQERERENWKSRQGAGEKQATGWCSPAYIHGMPDDGKADCCSSYDASACWLQLVDQEARSGRMESGGQRGRENSMVGFQYEVMLLINC